jgi:hypothetical protein
MTTPDIAALADQIEGLDGELLSDGQYSVRYPFVRERTQAFWEADGNGVPEIDVWRPGIVYEECGPEDVEAVAHGEGRMLLNIVSTHKPGRYPERVFYERRWVDPDGKVFGRSKLLIATREKFRRLADRYAHPYALRAHLEARADG